MNLHDILIFDGRQQLDVNSVGYEDITPEWNTPKRTIRDYEIIVVARGVLTFRIKDREVEIREGEAGLLLPRRVHSAPTGQSSQMYWMHFSIPEASPPCSPGQAREHLARMRQTPSTDTATRILPQMRLHEIVLAESMQLGPWRTQILHLLRIVAYEKKQPSSNSYWRISACVKEVLLLLSRQTIELLGGNVAPLDRGNWPLVQQALFHIREASTWSLTVRALATEMHTTPQNLIRQFRRCVGISPGEAINETRVQRTRELMQDAALSLKEIAYATGARNAAEFSRWFRHHHGCSPSEYRQRALDE